MKVERGGATWKIDQARRVQIHAPQRHGRACFSAIPAPATSGEVSPGTPRALPPAGPTTPIVFPGLLGPSIICSVSMPPHSELDREAGYEQALGAPVSCFCPEQALCQRLERGGPGLTLLPSCRPAWTPLRPGFGSQSWSIAWTWRRHSAGWRSHSRGETQWTGCWGGRGAVIILEGADPAMPCSHWPAHQSYSGLTLSVKNGTGILGRKGQ